MAEENTIYVGLKPTQTYVLAALIQFNNGAQKIKIVARGRAISKAVDVAEILRNKVIPNLKVENIEIGTERIETNDGRRLNVSTISIVLSR